MKKLQNRGFTLIELLVVIAIIGILSSVVLASLTSARTKGQDAAVQSTLSNMRAQAELYYSSNNNAYSAIESCTTAGSIFSSATSTGSLKSLTEGAESQNGASTLTCRSSASAWAVASPLPSNPLSFFCVDSRGNAISTSSAPAAGNFACNN